MASFTTQKVIIHQVATMLATSKKFSGHLLTTNTDDPTLWLLHEPQRVKGHQHWWLAGGYDQEIGHF